MPILEVPIDWKNIFKLLKENKHQTYFVRHYKADSNPKLLVRTEELEGMYRASAAQVKIE